MNNFEKILHNLEKRSNGEVRIVKTTQEKRLTAESLEDFERKVGAQISSNEAMRQRSYFNANKKS